MKEKPFDVRPTLGVKIVLTILCIIVGAIIAVYLLR